MSTTFYSPTYTLGDAQLRVGIIYNVSTTNTAVTVSGTIYLDHKGGQSLTSASYYAICGLTLNDSTPISASSSSVISGTYYSGYVSPYVKTSAVSTQSVSSHSSWTAVYSKAFSFTRNKTTSSQTLKLLAGLTSSTSSSQDYVWAGAYKTVSVPALTSYNVTYNANGGSGAPATQKKYYGKTLTLSSTKPTRTNYVFKNWNTASGGTGTTYNPGASYTGNAALTLYAQWYAPYTVTYNANGGSGAPASQTKVYNTALKLSTTKPTRSGFAFLGWSTSSSATSPNSNYDPGDTYSTNANLTLYAVWDATPSITSLSAVRCDALGVDADEGAYARISCTWKVDNALGDTGAITGTITPQGGSATSFTFGTNPTGSGTVSSVAIVGSGNGMTLDTDTQYTVSVTVRNASSGSTQTASRNVILTRAFFVMDWKAGGGAVGIGRAAPESGLEVGFDATFDESVTMLDTVTIQNAIPELKFTSSGGTPYTSFIRSYDTNAAGAGHNMVIQSGGNTILGSGESGISVYNSFSSGYFPTPTSEDVVISSDQYIRFYPGFNSGSTDAAYVLISTDGSLILRGTPFKSSPGRASLYIDSPQFAIGTSAQNGITENKYTSLYFRDSTGNWSGTVENQACYDSDSTAANAGAVRTYMQSRNMKSDGTRVSNHFSVYVRKDGSLHYSCGSPTNLRSDFDLAQRSILGYLTSAAQGSSSDVSMANDTSVNLGSYTFSTAGTYIICAGFRFASNATGFRQGIISTTSAENAAPMDRCVMVQASNGWQTILQVTYIASVSANAKYYFVGKQKSGGALTGNVYWRIWRLK